MQAESTISEPNLHKYSFQSKKHKRGKKGKDSLPKQRTSTMKQSKKEPTFQDEFFRNKEQSKKEQTQKKSVYEIKLSDFLKTANSAKWRTRYLNSIDYHDRDEDQKQKFSQKQIQNTKQKWKNIIPNLINSDRSESSYKGQKQIKEKKKKVRKELLKLGQTGQKVSMYARIRKKHELVRFRVQNLRDQQQHYYNTGKYRYRYPQINLRLSFLNGVENEDREGKIQTAEVQKYPMFTNENREKYFDFICDRIKSLSQRVQPSTAIKNDLMQEIQ